jgi:hypothetical protein
MRLRSARRHHRGASSHKVRDGLRHKFDFTSWVHSIQLNQKRTTYRMTIILLYIENGNRVVYSCLFVHDLFYFLFGVTTWYSSIVVIIDFGRVRGTLRFSRAFL